MWCSLNSRIDNANAHSDLSLYNLNPYSQRIYKFNLLKIIGRNDQKKKNWVVNKTLKIDILEKLIHSSLIDVIHKSTKLIKMAVIWMFHIDHITTKL